MMGNVLRVFLRDLKRLAKTPAAWSVMLFLAVLPSLYTWFNVTGFWNPYENTRNLAICVVNEDEAVEDDRLGTLDLGARLVEQLADNEQLGWEFVDRDTAIERTSSGEAYAAFVIPSDFSANVTTLLSGDFHQPTIQYYVNEKTGPVSPKITDTGANALDTTINDTFFSTVSSTVVETLNTRLQEASAHMKDAEGDALAKVDKAVDDIESTRESLKSLEGAAREGIAKTEEAKTSLEDAKSRIDAIVSEVEQVSQHAAEANGKLIDVSGKAHSSLDTASTDLAKASSETTLALAKANEAIEHARSVAEGFQTTSGEWAELRKQLDEAARAAGDSAAPVEELVDNTIKRADDYRNALSANSIPMLKTSLSRVSSASNALGSKISSQKTLVDQTSLMLGQLESTLNLSTEALMSTDGMLAELEGDLTTIRTDLAALQASSTLGETFGNTSIDPNQIANFMMSPTQVEQVELYPLNAYGSAMAPLFINLTLWIGAFMLMVIVRLEVDDEGIEDLTITQRFLGRSMILAIMAALQAAICCTGCILLGVQTANVPLFYATAIIASLAYLGIQYTLSSTLQHVGKALCIILVFVQIPGATGLYPIEMTPDFFHMVYPLFPFTYGINAIRETISGFYQNAWACNVGMLFLFLSVFAVIGIAVRPYMTNLNRLFAREIEESDIVNVESVQLPARRYRMSQVIRAFADRDEYREALNRRVARFMGLYPTMKKIAFGAGVTVPLLATAVMGLLHVDKVITLTSWLVWFALVVAFLITVEYIRDYLSHLVSLDGMSTDDMREIVTKHDRLTRVMPIGEDRPDGGKVGGERDE